MKWVEIKDYPDYEISTSGEVRDRHTKKKLHRRADVFGDCRVSVRHKNGKLRSLYIGRTMVKTFLGEEYGHKTHRIQYKDGNPMNPSLSNIEVHPILRKGVREKTTGLVFNSRKECCAYFNIHYSTLSHYITGLSSSPIGLQFEEFERS